MAGKMVIKINKYDTNVKKNSKDYVISFNLTKTKTDTPKFNYIIRHGNIFQWVKDNYRHLLD